MEHLYEYLVMHYVTRKGDVFLCPQFGIYKDESNKNVWGMWPDFVALDYSDFQHPTVQVVEVSITSNAVAKYTDRLNSRAEWIEYLKKQLGRLGVAREPHWKWGVRVFVLAGEKLKLEKRFKGCTDVQIEAIEDAVLWWAPKQ